jgi:glutathione synthase/RimK-type ligase-like ATP-grasp enzyme
MADISLLYDRSETDELGIRLTAEQIGVELGFLPFYKVSIGFDEGGFSYASSSKDFTEELKETRVVINRAQSKNRRIYASMFLEAFGKEMLNPLTMELFCQSKIRTLLEFSKNGVRIPRTVYVPCNPRDARVGGGQVDNSETVSDLIVRQLDDERVVVKPDEGTHGRGVLLAEDHERLREILSGLRPSLTSPVGVVAQEYVPKWFYDLRIVVEKEKGRGPLCHPTAMARGGFGDFRTNAHLKNMVFRVNLPANIREDAVSCANALGKDSKAWVVALDAMPRIGDELIHGEDELREAFSDLDPHFQDVVKVKLNPRKLWDFRSYTAEVEGAYSRYMETDEYARISATITDTLNRVSGSVCFHECNACPEFWEQTRIVGGVNVAEALLRSAESLLDS